MNKMSTNKFALSFFLVLCTLVPTFAHAQEAVNLFYRGHVTQILEESEKDTADGREVTQKVKVELQYDEKQKDITVENAFITPTDDHRRLEQGEKVVIGETLDPDGNLTYFLSDFYRLPALVAIGCFFFFIIALFAGKRGILSFFGLGFSILVLSWYVVPQISAGKNPLLVSFIGALFIVCVSLYLAHGFRARTTVALISTLVTVFISLILSVLFVKWSKLFGLGTEEAFFLQTAPIEALSLKGLLLGGIIIGTLGVLDDVTTAQSAAVEELKKANPSLEMRELYKRGMSIGHEHITALVNTLVLAYVGASLPLLLLFTIYKQPLWVTLNSELVMEEIIRTLVGSTSLIFAVPITTLFSAYYWNRHHK